MNQTNRRNIDLSKANAQRKVNADKFARMVVDKLNSMAIAT